MTGIKWEDRDASRWIHLEGELDYDGCAELGDSFREAVESGGEKVIVNMTDVTFVASQCLRMFLETNRILKNRGGSLHIANPRAHVRKVFETTGLFMAIPEFEA